MKELSRSWPIMGIAIVLWLGVVILRTPALGIDGVRVVSILVSSASMFTLGVYVQRILTCREAEKQNKEFHP